MRNGFLGSVAVLFAFVGLASPQVQYQQWGRPVYYPYP